MTKYNALSNALSYMADADDGDAWGSLMAYRFAIAAALARGDHQVPESWQYRPGAFGPEAADGHLDECLDACEPDDLRNLGHILKIATDALDAAGASY